MFIIYNNEKSHIMNEKNVERNSWSGKKVKTKSKMPKWKGDKGVGIRANDWLKEKFFCVWFLDKVKTYSLTHSLTWRRKRVFLWLMNGGRKAGRPSASYIEIMKTFCPISNRKQTICRVQEEVVGWVFFYGPIDCYESYGEKPDSDLGNWTLTACGYPKPTLLFHPLCLSTIIYKNPYSQTLPIFSVYDVLCELIKFDIVFVNVGFWVSKAKTFSSNFRTFTGLKSFKFRSV